MTPPSLFVLSLDGDRWELLHLLPLALLVPRQIGFHNISHLSHSSSTSLFVGIIVKYIEECGIFSNINYRADGMILSLARNQSDDGCSPISAHAHRIRCFILRLLGRFPKKGHQYQLKHETASARWPSVASPRLLRFDGLSTTQGAPTESSFWKHKLFALRAGLKGGHPQCDTINTMRQSANHGNQGTNL